ncbi:hypothetical protein CEP54_015456 [Fusarium duplospermum]|uniref:Rhodopsin domain-containing protein n=1 Tax=Fusarium duplospermum TaxID=1325734 RepID=A0A428NNZ8_9HYPO|nr:hypothetical protein CEP54_015456 [Fusarium duplospermum]
MTDGLIHAQNGLVQYRARINLGFVLIAITYIAIMASIFLGCRPFHRFWQIYPDPGNLCQPATSKLFIFLVLTLNIVTDIYLIAIPIPVLWRAKLPKFKKIVLIILFSGGVFVMVAGILRCVLILKVRPCFPIVNYAALANRRVENQNPTTGPQQAASWAVRESFVAVVTSSAPMICGWIRQKLQPLYPSLLASTKHRGTGAYGDNEDEWSDFQQHGGFGSHHRVQMDIADRQHVTRSGNWTSVWAESRPTLKSTQCL